MPKELRFAIMCQGTTLCKWEIMAIEKMLALGPVRLVLLIVEQREPENRSRRILRKILNFRRLLWTAYENTRKFKSAAPVDCSGTFAQIDTLSCEVERKGRFSQYFKAEDIDTIRRHDLDFILKFGFGIIRGDILTAARHGVWSFHHDDEEKYRGGPPCFWEIYYGDGVTGGMLQKLNNKLDAGVVLKKGYLRTIFSYKRNRDQLYFETSNWPAQVCRELLAGNLDLFEAPPSATGAPVFRVPTNTQFIAYFFRSAFFLLRKLLRDYLYIDYWNIGVAHAPVSAFLDPVKPPVQWFPLPSKKFFVADPFGLPDPDDPSRLHLFFETCHYGDGKGIIQYCTYHPASGFSRPVTVIDYRVHLSYPFVFRQGNDIFILPESARDRRVQLFRAAAFPLKWEQDITLLQDYRGVDSTLLEKDNRYWLFTTDKSMGGSHTLSIHSTGDFRAGPWTPHPLNPVKVDVRGSRCAGTPFVFRNEIYRPAMDYSEKVEGRIVIHKITQLTQTAYREERAALVEPYAGSRFPDKIHTLSAAGDYTVVDGAREAFIFSSFTFFKAKLSSLF